MQSDLSSGGNDRIDGIESQEVAASSEVSVCPLVLSVYLQGGQRTSQSSDFNNTSRIHYIAKNGTAQLPLIGF